MKKRLKLYILLFLILFPVAALFSQEALAQRWCCLCAMDLIKYSKTKYILILTDESKRYTCSIHCAAIILNKEQVKKVEAADYLTGSMIEADKSYYIVGSDIKGVMSKVSKLAFASKSQAIDFQKKHGGELTDFKGALKQAETDMAEDVKMLKKKAKNMIKMGKVVAEENSCFACHGIDGRGGIKNPGLKNRSVPAWNTKEFAQAFDSKAKLKKMILKGKAGQIPIEERGALKMPAWENLIKGKELHTLVNYIWSLKNAGSDKR